MFDLSQFEQVPTYAPDNQIGIVVALPISAVIEDETQPRTEFDPEALNKLAVDIGRRGVQAPIAVRPAVEGLYKIIHGARRYRASRIAGMESIPAIVQSDRDAFDDYSQVLENTQRNSLTPMDIARFIHKRKTAGESNSDIARKLSEKPEWVTYHLALVDLPEEIRQAYENGQIKGAKSAYELRKLHGKDPDTVKKLIESGAEITQGRIREIVNPDKSVAIKTVNATASEPSDKMAVAVAPVRNASQSPSKQAKPESAQPETRPSETLLPASSLPGALIAPSVIGIYQSQPVQVLIHLKPSESGLVWIKTPGISGQQEVPADMITLSRIEEQRT